MTAGMFEQIYKSFTSGCNTCVTGTLKCCKITTLMTQRLQLTTPD